MNYSPNSLENHSKTKKHSAPIQRIHLQVVATKLQVCAGREMCGDRLRTMLTDFILAFLTTNQCPNWQEILAFFKARRIETWRANYDFFKSWKKWVTKRWFLLKIGTDVLMCVPLCSTLRKLCAGLNNVSNPRAEPIPTYLHIMKKVRHSFQLTSEGTRAGICSAVEQTL
jgi:hypothetical protein